MSFEMSRLFRRLNRSLGCCHPSMSDERNPVLVIIDGQEIEIGKIRDILAEYSLLPGRIVEFLSTGMSRVRMWPDVTRELERNIGEELGSRTNARSHYDILRDALLNELQLDVSDMTPSCGSARLLRSLRDGLTVEPPAFVGGVLYGLEASAIPELTIVAQAINAYARLRDFQTDPIDLVRLTTPTEENNHRDYKELSLNSFFAAHLKDFEVGHRDGLAKAFGECITLSHDVSNFEAGFEHALEAMDEWWEFLACPRELIHQAA